MKNTLKISLLVLALNLSFSTFSQSSYNTGIGIRGGFTSGLSIKHFISNNAALEGVLGSRYRGYSFTGLFELHKGNALGVSRLSWEYGLGARVGYYDGRYYKYKEDKYYYDNHYTVFSLVGIFGLEYHFEEVPFTLGIDLMPYFDLNYGVNNYIDASLSFRYAF